MRFEPILLNITFLLKLTTYICYCAHCGEKEQKKKKKREGIHMLCATCTVMSHETILYTHAIRHIQERICPIESNQIILTVT